MLMLIGSKFPELSLRCLQRMSSSEISLQNRYLFGIFYIFVLFTDKSTNRVLEVKLQQQKKVEEQGLQL